MAAMDQNEVSTAQLMAALTTAITRISEGSYDSKKSLSSLRKAATGVGLTFSGTPIGKRGTTWRDFMTKLGGLQNEFKWLKPLLKMAEGTPLQEGEILDPEDDEKLLSLLKYVVADPALDELTLAEDTDRIAGVAPSGIRAIIRLAEWSLPKNNGAMWDAIVEAMTVGQMPAKGDPTAYLAAVTKSVRALKTEFGVDISGTICVAFAMRNLPSSYSTVKYEISKLPHTDTYTFEQFSKAIQSYWAAMLKMGDAPKGEEATQDSSEMGRMLAALEDIRKRVGDKPTPDKKRGSDPRLAATRRKQALDKAMAELKAQKVEGANEPAPEGTIECWYCNGPHKKNECPNRLGGQQSLAAVEVSEPEQIHGDYYGLTAVEIPDVTKTEQLPHAQGSAGGPSPNRALTGPSPNEPKRILGLAAVTKRHPNYEASPDERGTAASVEMQDLQPPGGIWDTGATSNMFSRREYFSQLYASATSKWSTAGGGVARPSGSGETGDIVIVRLKASLMEDSPFNLISAGYLEDSHGLYASLDEQRGMLFDCDGDTQVGLRRTHGVYRVKEKPDDPSKPL
jgi:hypothetical protein